MKSQQALIKELAGSECQCGRKKRRGNTFCNRCYFSLSPARRNALYRRIGEGYEKAYSQAMEDLISTTYPGELSDED